MNGENLRFSQEGSDRIAHSKKRKELFENFISILKEKTTKMNGGGGPTWKSIPLY